MTIDEKLAVMAAAIHPVAWLVNTKVSGQPEYRVSEPGAPGAFPVYTDVQEGGDAVVLVQRQLFNRVVGRLDRLSRRASNAAGTVKELEWIDHTEGPGCPIRRIAQPFAGHVIWIFQARETDLWYLSYNNGLRGKFLVKGTEDEAKAAAQADFTQRILSSLEPASSVEGEEPVAEDDVIALILQHLGASGMRALTHNHGPYEITRCNHGVMEFARALAGRRPSPAVSAEVTERLRCIIHDLLAVQTDPRFPSSARVKASIMAQAEAALAALNGGRENG